MTVHLLTWTTYGSWLPGDERGFMSRIRTDDGRNVLPNEFNTPRPRGGRSLEASARQRMAGGTITLSDEQALLVASVIDRSAERHGILIRIGAVMNTHVHLVTQSKTVGGSEQLRLFKGGTARELTRAFGSPTGRWWTRSGSIKPKFEADEKRTAEEYVSRHQALAWCGEQVPRDKTGEGPPD